MILENVELKMKIKPQELDIQSDKKTTFILEHLATLVCTIQATILYYYTVIHLGSYSNFLMGAIYDFVFVVLPLYSAE